MAASARAKARGRSRSPVSIAAAGNAVLASTRRFPNTCSGIAAVPARGHARSVAMEAATTGREFCIERCTAASWDILPGTGCTARNPTDDLLPDRFPSIRVLLRHLTYGTTPFAERPSRTIETSTLCAFRFTKSAMSTVRRHLPGMRAAGDLDQAQAKACSRACDDCCQCDPRASGWSLRHRPRPGRRELHGVQAVHS